MVKKTSFDISSWSRVVVRLGIGSPLAFAGSAGIFLFYQSNTDYENDTINKNITKNEIQKAIQELHNYKSTGPDGIKNEFIKYGGENLKNEILKLFENIYHTENIPEQWKLSYIVNIDKGKKDKEDLNNKRGISLCSNIGKIFEKIIVNRLNTELNFTEAQAGARTNRNCVQQIFTIKSIIQDSYNENKELYVTYIDLEKAYDRAWADGIFYIIWQRGVRGKIWRLMYNLNKNQTTRVITKYGLTNNIELKNSIRQGRPLSGPEFAVLIDELESFLQAEGFNIKYGHLLIITLLFMDDIALFSKSEKDLQTLLNTTELFLNKWKLKVNIKKSAVMIFNEQQRGKEKHFYIDDKEIKIVKEYKYLGELITENLKIKEHLLEKQQLINGIVHTCLFSASYEAISNIKMTTLIKLYKSCIIPTLLYGCETWILTNEEKKLVSTIQMNTLKMIMKVPDSSPNAAVLAEIGEKPIILTIEERQLTFLRDLLNTKTRCNDIFKIQLEQKSKKSITQHILTLLEKHNIQLSLDQITKMSKDKWKKTIKKATWIKANQWYDEESKRLSKLKVLRKYKTSIKKESYVTQLTRSETSLIFKSRTRMLNLKENFKNNYKNDLKCPRCKEETDSETHLFENCKPLKKLYEKFNIKQFEEIFKMVEVGHFKNITSFLKEVSKIYEVKF